MARLNSARNREDCRSQELRCGDYEECVFDLLRFWKYDLYAILRFFGERRRTGEGKASDTTPQWEKRTLHVPTGTQKTTNEIRKLLSNAKLDFESVTNQALNAYLPRIFHSCPFTEDICTIKQCIDCEVFKNSAKK
jgi:hypothetical protein